MAKLPRSRARARGSGIGASSPLVCDPAKVRSSGPVPINFGLLCDSPTRPIAGAAANGGFVGNSARSAEGQEGPPQLVPHRLPRGGDSQISADAGNLLRRRADRGSITVENTADARHNFFAEPDHPSLNHVVGHSAELED